MGEATGLPRDLQTKLYLTHLLNEVYKSLRVRVLDWQSFSISFLAFFLTGSEA